MGPARSCGLNVIWCVQQGVKWDKESPRTGNGTFWMFSWKVHLQKAFSSQILPFSTSASGNFPLFLPVDQNLPKRRFKDSSTILFSCVMSGLCWPAPWSQGQNINQNQISSFFFFFLATHATQSQLLESDAKKPQTINGWDGNRIPSLARHALLPPGHHTAALFCAVSSSGITIKLEYVIYLSSM